MYYIIYKVTNLVNGKFYIGKHQTKDLNDGYLGSGKLLKRAREKYGNENFITEILEIYDQEWKMNLAEKILVVPDIEINYNICPGGQGGFGFINKNRDHKSHNGKLAKNRDYSKTDYTNSRIAAKEPERNKKITDTKRKNGSIVLPNNFGSKRGIESRNKMRDKKLGSNNNNFGKCWVKNAMSSILIKREDIDLYLSEGYIPGRFISKK